MGPAPIPGLTSLALTWSQTTTYTGVTIQALLNITDSNPGGAPGTAYLTNSLGPGATNVVPPASFVVPPTQTTPTLTTLFTNLTLPAGTYYLTISNATSNNLGWAVDGASTPSSGPGVTVNGPGQPDKQDNASPGAYSPPASPTFIPASAGGSNFVLLFSVTSTPPAPIPTLSQWGLAGSMLLLMGSGLLLVGRLRRQE